jgi:hypothetical protein
MKTTKTTLFPVQRPNLANNDENAPQEVKEFFTPNFSIYPPAELVTKMNEFEYDIFLGVLEFITRTNNPDFKFCIGDVNYRIMSNGVFFDLCQKHVIEFAAAYFEISGPLPDLLNTSKLVDFFQKKDLLHNILKFTHDQTVMIYHNGDFCFYHLLS